MFIPDPDFYPSRIPDPTTPKEEGGKEIVVLFTQKFAIQLSKIWVWDPGSENRDPGSENRDPGSKRYLPDVQIPDPDPQHWFFTSHGALPLMKILSQLR